MKRRMCVALALAAGGIFAEASLAQAVRSASMVRGEGRAWPVSRVLAGGKVIKQGGGQQDVPQVVYDNAPDTGGFYFYENGPTTFAAVDRCSFAPGPGAGGPVTFTTLGDVAFVLPPSDPGGDFDLLIDFYNTVDEFAPAGTPVNVGPLGQQIKLEFRMVPPNTTINGQFYTLTLPVDIAAAGITVPDDNFGVKITIVNAGTTTLHPTVKLGWNGNPTGGGPFPSVGASTDNFWFDFNLNGIIEASERYWFNGGQFTANLYIKLEGEIGGTVPCYANCDGSTTEPILNVNDFICFQGKYAAGDPAANCDGSTTEPVLNVNDFICFQGKYAAGCP